MTIKAILSSGILVLSASSQLLAQSSSVDRQLASCLATLSGELNQSCTVTLDLRDPAQKQMGSGIASLLRQGLSSYQVRLPRADPWTREVTFVDSEHYTIELKSAYEEAVSPSYRDAEFRYTILKLQEKLLGGA